MAKSSKATAAPKGSKGSKGSSKGSSKGKGSAKAASSASASPSESVSSETAASVRYGSSDSASPPPAKAAAKGTKATKAKATKSSKASTKTPVRAVTKAAEEDDGDGTFVFWSLACQIVIVVLFGVFVRYSPDSDVYQPIAQGATAVESYPLVTDVTVMVFVGFGFLMTFMRRYAFSGVGFVMLIAVLSIQWYILVGGFWERVLHNEWHHKITVDVKKILLADFAAASMLISFGGVMGKLSPSQLMIMSVSHICFYSLNEAISLFMGISDIGGSMVIHAFGAYFGLAVSAVTTTVKEKKRVKIGVVATDFNTEIFAMIGTLFLFCFWPSFNAAPSVGGNQRNRAVTNTMLCLCASAFAAFVGSSFFRRERKFFMVDVQNATLAGGVAVGAVADMNIHPVGALIIGYFAGFVSVYGFARVTSRLEKWFGLYDTAGINNLHGMPGIIGGVASSIMAGIASMAFYGDSMESLTNVYPQRAMETKNRSAYRQAGLQMGFLLITLGIAITSGLVTGLVLRWLPNRCATRVTKSFEDEFWDVPGVHPHVEGADTSVSSDSTME